MTTQFHVPASMAVIPQMLPPCCARHGAPAAVWKPVTFESRPPSWVYLTLILGWLPPLIILMAMRRQVRVPAWPFCPQCIHRHRQRLLLALALSATCLGASIVALVIAAGSDYEVVAVVGFLSAILGTPLIGLAVGSSASWRSIADGFASRDGMLIVFPRLSRVFVSGLHMHQIPIPTSGPAAYGVPGRW